MIITTTPTLQGERIREYLGIVTGETIIGANVFKDIMASIRDIVGAARERTRTRSGRPARGRSARWPRRRVPAVPTR